MCYYWRVPISLSHLNPDQIQAIEHDGGPALILAGAGSGKTTVLTHRAAWLIDNKPSIKNHILLVTFTNKAAQEMMSRIQLITGDSLQYGGTFHSVCARILRKHAPAIGFPHEFILYDSDDQLALIKQLYKSARKEPSFKPAVAKAFISKAKNEFQLPIDLRTIASNQNDEELANIYEKYQEALRLAQAMDFDDLLLNTLLLLQQNEAIAKHYQEEFSQILVDEYQDTNKTQYALTKIWAESHSQVFVVGDFCQSIYSWRGADFRNMMQFKEDFPDHKQYELEQNYRSGKHILDAASSIISHNTTHPTLKLWTEKTESVPVKIRQFQDSDEEAHRVVYWAKKDQELGRSTAILFRVNAQSRSFEEACIQLGINYNLVGGTRFYERREIKDVIAYARLFLVPEDSVSLERISKLGKRQLKNFQAWCANNSNLRKKPAIELLKSILSASNYLERYDERILEDQARIDSVMELVSMAENFQTLSELLEQVALFQDTDAIPSEMKKDTLLLMSLHAAKGLEFDSVFLVGMEEGLLPHSRSLFDPFQLEEERRLCYVGITRAKQQATLSYASKRILYGRFSSMTPSRFLSELSLESIGESASHSFEGNKRLENKAKISQNISQSQNIVPERKIVSDDDLDAFLSGEISVKTFVRS